MTTGSGAAGWRTTKKSRTHLLPSQNCDSQRNHSARVPVRPSCQGRAVALNRSEKARAARGFPRARKDPRPQRRPARRARLRRRAGRPFGARRRALGRAAARPRVRGTPARPQLAHRIGIADSTLRQSRPRHHLPDGHRSTPREQALNGRPARRTTPPPSGPATCRTVTGRPRARAAPASRAGKKRLEPVREPAEERPTLNTLPT